MQTSSMGMLQKKSLEHNDCLYVAASILQQRVRKSPTDNISSPQNYFQTNYRSVIPSNAFKKHRNNTVIICLNIILQTWDMFLHNGLTELHMFFMTRSTTFFSSTVFVISRLLFFLKRR